MKRFQLLGFVFVLVVATGGGCPSSGAATCDVDDDCFQNEECRAGTCQPADDADAGGHNETGDTGEADDTDADADTEEDDASDDLTVHSCVDSCTTDDHCSGKHKSCEGGFCWSNECETNTDCRQHGYWGPECTSDDECESLDRCIDVGDDDEGRCALEIIGDEGCTGDGSIPYEEETFEDSETVTVCGNRHGYCDDEGDRSHCESEQRMIRQECTTDGDCGEFFGADTCYDGICGCSDTTFCQSSLGSSYTCVERP